MKLNIYNEDGTVKKVCQADTLDLEFGTVRKLMQLLDIESSMDTTDLLKKLYSAWDEIVKILGKCFKDVEYEDWEHVKVKELMPVLVKIFKFSIFEIAKIPSDSKN